MDRPLLTPQQAADLLQLSVGTLENLRLKGRGPAYVKLGPHLRSHVRYRREDLESWLKPGKSCPKCCDCLNT